MLKQTKNITATLRTDKDEFEKIQLSLNETILIGEVEFNNARCVNYLFSEIFLQQFQKQKCFKV